MPNILFQETIVQYITNVSQTVYSFAFYAPLPTDILVYYQAPNALPIPATDILSLNNQYTVTYNSDPTTGGVITLLFTPTTGFYLTIDRQVAPSLNTNFANAQTFNGANLDAALDTLLLVIQQNFNYIMQRNLSYVVNSYLPDAQPFTQLPVLANLQVWQGTPNGVAAVTLEEEPNSSTLRSQLANNSPGTDGASIVGYYDVVNSIPTTVDAFLQGIVPFIKTQLSQSLLPSGVILDFGGGSVPAGFLLCNGAAVSRTTYANLFTAIGTTWGVGDGSTTFNVPNFQRSVAVGSGGVGSAILGSTLGSSGGEEKHTMLEVELATHSHPGSTVPCTAISLTGGALIQYPNAGGAVLEPVNVAADGSSTPFNVIQPSLVVTKIIKT